ncbi:MAG: TauD/TfdA family dioxygenase [Paracoccaceae bacterium]
MGVAMRQSDAQFSWATGPDGLYQAWRSQKLAAVAQISEPTKPIEIRSLGAPSSAEIAEITRRCQVLNAVPYASDQDADQPDIIRNQLRGFTQAFGLQIAETHRSAGQQGIVALQQSQKSNQRAYIPYSKKPMNWHTDGYYNGPDEKIRAMVLHCVQPAKDGGVNQFLDPEIAYIRLRDENPSYIDALMHPRAMTIPENQEPGGTLRPVSIGPVFLKNSEAGHLEMRYTARTRSIAWRKDALTQEAVEFLGGVLRSDDPFIQTIKMQAGGGVLCNNSLHNRTGFDPNLDTDSDRLVFRVRFHNRVSGS